MRLLIDTSAWVDYLRGAGTPAANAVRHHLLAPATEVFICEPIAMELLAGAGDHARVRKLETLVNGLPSLSIDPWADFRDAAQIYRTARVAGETIRSLIDCLIAAVALNHAVTVLHKDRDFDAIAQVTGLRSITGT